MIHGSIEPHEINKAPRGTLEKDLISCGLATRESLLTTTIDQLRRMWLLAFQPQQRARHA